MAFGKTDQYNAYYMAAQTVSKTRQVVMLYDGAIRFMQQARLAVEETRIEDRFNLLNKASEVLLGLQGSLDFDNGGNVAPLLYDYYSSLDARILYVQRSNDLKILDSVIAELKQMRGAWGDVDSQQTTGAPAPAKAEVNPAKLQSSTAVAPSSPASAPISVDGSVFVSA
ncbi:MAG: flagellar export chaperone FliS [Rickettsiales bacterium]|nr:flagellar export chaperone FliS [Rickettsiales bacterium]